MTTKTPGTPFTRILVAVDGSDHGRSAARVASGLARALGARLTLLTVYEPSSALGDPETRKEGTMKLERILVPLDGSSLAEAALATAVEKARASGARLLLLRAAQAHTLPGMDPTEAELKAVREAETYLAEVQARLARAGTPDVETTVWYGPSAVAIIEAAEFRKVGLIVMTTHGRTGLGRLILGSVAESVLRGSVTPILLLRADGAPVEMPAGRAEPVAPGSGRG
jgi:nucleotide-binding universal stress UspA family protein